MIGSDPHIDEVTKYMYGIYIYYYYYYYYENTPQQVQQIANVQYQSTLPPPEVHTFYVRFNFTSTFVILIYIGLNDMRKLW